ncbi:Major facilitator superfamily domain general substrate transporter [Penicillium angulare]|uniref:Major facilitator superfamily domain general substrate transporter n=1 Tax=Penicillium angulare TaxID=116970 RepID=UPI0025419E9C|nr:Major facilitator superfamily domain general substrate transporter [Penicillium angulare]KAJ5272464.1 Major facilitator superfamily domain general substrate transporter [Penicillium angulare]
MSSLIPLFFVPETLSSTKNTIDQESDEVGCEQPHPRSIRFQLSQSLDQFLASFSALKSYSLIIVSSIFLAVTPDLVATSQFMAQYISKRFGWSLAKAGYLITLRGAINLIVLLLLLPLLSKILLRYRSPAAKDLILASVSIIFIAAGALLMAAPQIGTLIVGLAVHSLGSGLSPILRSLATSYVAKEDMTKLNTILGMVEMSGTLFAGPVLAWSFDAGMKLGGILMGLPYFGLAGSFMLCFVGLLFVRSSSSEPDLDE